MRQRAVCVICDIVISICNQCCAEGFASADATRGQWKQTNVCGRPLDPFAFASHVTWFYRYKGDKKENNGSSRNLGGKSRLGARLRTRKVRGRDASLPAPLLAASLGLVGRGTVGALPQTPQGTLSLDPSARLSWSRFHAPSACSFLVLRLSPCLLPQLSVKNIILPVTPLLPHPPRHTPPPHPCLHSPAVLSGTSTARDDPAPDYTPIESAVRRNPPAPSA